MHRNLSNVILVVTICGFFAMLIHFITQPVKTIQVMYLGGKVENIADPHQVRPGIGDTVLIQCYYRISLNGGLDSEQNVIYGIYHRNLVPASYDRDSVQVEYWPAVVRKWLYK